MNEIAALAHNVSRETLDQLEVFAGLLTRWNRQINLVSPATIPDLWSRHILDSAQLFVHAPHHAKHWLDLGSGGGLPGLVCAILAKTDRPHCRFTLIESDKRKAAFLTTAVRELALNVVVLSKRAETAVPQQADIVSARALAPLSQLLPLVARHLRAGGIALLPKGKTHEQELAAARAEWHFDVTSIVSQTDDLARLLIIKDMSRA